MLLKISGYEFSFYSDFYLYTTYLFALVFIYTAHISPPKLKVLYEILLCS